jgi:carboxypeptidase C (cathepsin A)
MLRSLLAVLLACSCAAAIAAATPDSAPPRSFVSKHDVSVAGKKLRYRAIAESQSYLPTYAATAWYHHKIPDASDLPKLLTDAREFALSDYAVALAKGQRMSNDDRARVRRRLAYFTGLSEQYLDSTDLDVHPLRFMKELLRDQGLAVGRLDSRCVGRDFDAAADRFDADPSQYGFGAAFATAALHYLSVDLGVDMGAMRYVALNRGRIKPDWDWKMPDTERWSMGMNPSGRSTSTSRRCSAMR